MRLATSHGATEPHGMNCKNQFINPVQLTMDLGNFCCPQHPRFRHASQAKSMSPARKLVTDGMIKQDCESQTYFVYETAVDSCFGVGGAGTWWLLSLFPSIVYAIDGMLFDLGRSCYRKAMTMKERDCDCPKSRIAARTCSQAKTNKTCRRAPAHTSCYGNGILLPVVYCKIIRS